MSTPTTPKPVARAGARPRRPAPRRRRGVALRLAQLTVAVLLAGAAAGLASAEEEPEAHAAEVRILDTLTFDPKHLVVHAGDTVVWYNDSMLVHTVTADPKLAALPEDVALPDGASPFDSGFLAPDAIFRHRFTRPGTYRYFCLPHEGAKMIGTVEVRPLP